MLRTGLIVVVAMLALVSVGCAGVQTGTQLNGMGLTE